MTKFLQILAFTILTVISFSSYANAGGSATVLSGTDETSASIGLRYNFGDMKPELVIGVSYTETDTDNDVTGVKGDMAIPLGPDVPPSATFRILGIFGNTDVQGVAGVGFNTATNQPLAAIGAQAPYVEGGVNFEFDGKISPYVGVNTDDGPEDRGSREVFDPGDMGGPMDVNPT